MTSSYHDNYTTKTTTIKETEMDQFVLSSHTDIDDELNTAGYHSSLMTQPAIGDTNDNKSTESVTVIPTNQQYQPQLLHLGELFAKTKNTKLSLAVSRLLKPKGSPLTNDDTIKIFIDASYRNMERLFYVFKVVSSNNKYGLTGPIDDLLPLEQITNGNSKAKVLVSDDGLSTVNSRMWFYKGISTGEKFVIVDISF